MGVDDHTFYDARQIALLPMGFCFPGSGRSGDLPPRHECAANWRQALLAQLPGIELTIAVGAYAINWHLPQEAGSLAEIASRWREFEPALFPAPHPSPRNNRWLRNHPWFEEEAVPALQARVQRCLSRR